MGTKKFNLIDKIIAYIRLHEVMPYVEKKDIVLDFGCGHQAYFLLNVKQNIRRGIGIDYDVIGTKNKNIELINYNFKNKLPFKKNFFNKIFLLAVLEHIPTNKVNELFFEFNRILSKKGRIILTTPTPASRPLLEFLAYKLHLISESEIRDHKKYYSKTDIKKITKNVFKLNKYKKFELGLNSLCVLGKI